MWKKGGPCDGLGVWWRGCLRQAMLNEIEHYGEGLYACVMDSYDYDYALDAVLPRPADPAPLHLRPPPVIHRAPRLRAPTGGQGLLASFLPRHGVLWSCEWSRRRGGACVGGGRVLELALGSEGRGGLGQCVVALRSGTG